MESGEPYFLTSAFAEALQGAVNDAVNEVASTGSAFSPMETLRAVGALLGRLGHDTAEVKPPPCEYSTTQTQTPGWKLLEDLGERERLLEGSAEDQQQREQKLDERERRLDGRQQVSAPT